MGGGCVCVWGGGGGGGENGPAQSFPIPLFRRINLLNAC